MTKTVHLGFAVGTGESVEIPIAHMVVTGQSQMAGKTTALDSLAAAAGVRSLAFVTKRGEGSFGGARRVAPYFRPRTDWQFVEAILESTMRQRMKFERAWIVKASRGAKTLADVRKNVQRLMEGSKRSMDSDIFMLLGEYLDQVLPVLAKLPLAAGVELAPGVNVADLSPYPVEVAGLVVSSMLSWVHEREEGVVCVVPESWKFIPQGRNSPVRMAAISLAREGAGLRNFLWLDSQDLAGAEKEVVRQSTVYLLGVQREANEIKRTLAHVPAGIKKPRAEDIATLGRGQFFACWETHAVKTYVQPIWLNAETARLHAMGMTKFEDLDPRPLLATARTEKMPETWAELRDHGHPPLTDEAADASIPVETTQEDDMTPAQEKKIDGLIDAMTKLVNKPSEPIVVRQKFEDHQIDPVAAELAAAKAPPLGTSEESLYQRFVARLKKEAPTLIRLLVDKSAIDVEITTKTVTMDGTILRGRIAGLVAGGFFDEPRNGGAVLRELARRGGTTGDRGNYKRELAWLAEAGFLTVEGDAFRVVNGMKVNIIRK